MKPGSPFVPILLLFWFVAGCATSKLYDPEWPPKREAKSVERPLRESNPQPIKNLFQDQRAAEIESSLGWGD